MLTFFYNHKLPRTKKCKQDSTHQLLCESKFKKKEFMEFIELEKKNLSN